MSKRVVLITGGVLVLVGAVLFSRGQRPHPGAEGRGPRAEGGSVNFPAEAGSGNSFQEAGGASQPAGPVVARQTLSREFNPAVNPYAGSLRQPGESHRLWESDFLQRFTGTSSNASIQFELTDGVVASGSIKLTQMRDGELAYISGELTAPDAGKFFFLTPPPGSKAGKAAGVVEFWGSKTAYRVEPTGPNGNPELWKRRLDEVLCQTMPLADEQPAPEVAEIPPLRADAVPDYAPEYNSNIVSLQSYPGSSAVLLLDFFGGYTPTWGGVTYPRPTVSNAQIKDLWKRVAEDYLPFNINVTTDLRVYQAAPASSRQKCVFSPSISAMPAGAAGVAYIGSWNWGSDTVCWSLYTSGKSGAEVGSHEAGHAVGLGHQGTSASGYFGGHGGGATGWAPIMGTGYYKNVTSWARGEYQDANNHEDELSVITSQNNNVAYRADDTADSLSASRHLEVYPGNTASAEGVIERTGDTDVFQFTTAGGQVALTVAPVGDWANLALTATLADAGDTIIASNNPQTVLSATISATVAPGTYTLRVTGAGRNNPLSDGFTSYGSLGYYSVTGSVAAARLPTRLSVAEHAPIGALVGTVYPISTNSAFLYFIASGNTGDTFAIDNGGTLRVANNAWLDYTRLATNTMLPVQFQLLVNITDLVNPALTELNRRVVISVLNVNDAPVISGFTTHLIEHTIPGTPVGALSVRDPDFDQQLGFAIVGGDPNGSFTIDDTGLISVAGDLDTAVQSAFSLAVAVSDKVLGGGLTSTGYVNINIVTNRTPFQTGSINYALYDGIGSGTAVSALTGHSRWPRDPSSERQMPSFEGIKNRADNFGAAMRGYLIPPQSGTYTFWIASDDSSELWFSATTNNSTLTRIAYVSSYTGSRQWTKYSSQQSAAISLTAGQGYYIEARMKEGGGDDSLAVAWRGLATENQTNLISGFYLAPCPVNYLPRATGFASTIRQGAFTGSTVGTITVSDVNVTDGRTFVLTAGNKAGLFSIDDKAGIIRVADEASLTAASTGTYNLTVTVTDSGLPPLSAMATASITLVDLDAVPSITLRREIWSNIGSGTAVSDLTNSAAFPCRPDKLQGLTSFASTTDTADSYGSRIRAHLTPTVSGSYRFFIASDDSSSLLLSTDDNPTNATRIAYVSGWTAANAWSSTSSQISALKSLTAGQRYYIEALQKEGGGGDHVEVAWAGPAVVDTNGLPATNVIAGSFLSPIDLNYPPRFPNQSLPVFTSVPGGTPIGRVIAQDSPLDTLSFRIVDGNTNGMFDIEPGTGTISVIDNTLIASGAVSNFLLTVAVQDSGYGGQYLPQTAQASVTINVQDPASGTFVWTGAASTNDWASPGNWGGAVPAQNVRLIFGYPWQQPNFNNLLGSADWVQLTNGGFKLSGNSLALAAGLTNRGDNTWAINTSLSSSQTWLNSSGTLSLTGAITNGGYPLTITANAEVRLSGSVSGAGGLTRNGTARLIMQGSHAYSGPTIVAVAGSTTTALEVGATDLSIPNSDLTLYGRMDLGNHDATIGALNGTGLIFASDLTRTLTLGANDHSGAFSGILQNSASASGITLNVVKVGSGTQILSGANAHSGVTVVMGGSLLVSSATALGSSAAGTIVTDGATLAISNNITISSEPLTLAGTGADGSGVLRNDYGVNLFNGALTLSGPTTIRAALGRLTLGGTWNTAGNVAAISFVTDPGAGILVSGAIEGGGALVKTGAGTLWLYGTNNYTGPTTISEGTLALCSGGSARRTSGFVIARGAYLSVTGVNGGWTLSPGQYLQGPGAVLGSAAILGTIMPGNSIGTFGFSGNLTLAGVVSVEIARAGGLLTNDVLSCSGVLTPGGVLSVSNTGPDPLALGDSFKIIDTTSFAPGSFATLNLPDLTPGLAWDTSTLGIDGTIRVQPANPPTIDVDITAAGAAAALTISWPDEYSGYILEAQTNGLSSGWFPVPGVSNNGILIPIDPANTSALYRLVKP